MGEKREFSVRFRARSPSDGRFETTTWISLTLLDVSGRWSEKIHPKDWTDAERAEALRVAGFVLQGDAVALTEHGNRKTVWYTTTEDTEDP